MKKTLLLLVGAIVATNAVAQMSRSAVIALHNYVKQKDERRAAKSTSVPDRWYNYGLAMDTSASYSNGVAFQYTQLCANTIWNDTNGTALDSGGRYHHQTMTCQASMFDPLASIFNDDPDGAYLGQMLVTDTDAYVWDSVEIFGTYLYNSTKTTEVDTLRLVFMNGSGNGFSYDNFTRDTIRDGLGRLDTIIGIKYDPVSNTATGPNLANLYPSTPPHYMDILLDNTNRNDTLPGGIWHMTIAVNGAVGSKDSAGFHCAISITYISGDPATHTGILSTPTPGDTLVGAWRGWGNSRYNVWCPLLTYYANGDGKTPAYPPYRCPTYEPDPMDMNCGYWHSPVSGWWSDKFMPIWNFEVVGGGATVMQYPFISWHIASCPTCGVNTRHGAALHLNKTFVVNDIKAYPDPGNNLLNISFELTEKADVSLSLTNMLGQVVASQKVNNTAAGKVVFNTATLPSGIYIYSLETNRSVTTGRIAITH